MTTYNFKCVSGTGSFVEGNVLSDNENPDELRAVCMRISATVAHRDGVSWDPFNAEMIIVRARKEPKPSNSSKCGNYLCPICGSTEQAHLCN